MGEHRDDEKELDPLCPIASVSLGAGRDFVFRHRDARGKMPQRRMEPVKLELAHGSLLLMNQPTNTFWYHSLPVRKRISQPRINLTFRRIRKKKWPPFTMAKTGNVSRLEEGNRLKARYSFQELICSDIKSFQIYFNTWKQLHLQIWNTQNLTSSYISANCSIKEFRTRQNLRSFDRSTMVVRSDRNVGSNLPKDTAALLTKRSVNGQVTSACQQCLYDTMASWG